LLERVSKYELNIYLLKKEKLFLIYKEKEIKMTKIEKILLFLTILIVLFNLTQINVFIFFEEENKIALISFILSMCALILILLIRVSKKIRDKNQ